MTVTLTGHILVPADRLEAVRLAAADHIRLTQAEPGCLRFDMVESPSEPGRFNLSEEFTDAAAFEAHQTRTKATHWATITHGIARNFDIAGL